MLWNYSRRPKYVNDTVTTRMFTTWASWVVTHQVSTDLKSVSAFFKVALILLNCFPHSVTSTTPSCRWKTRTWLVMRRQIKRSKRSRERANERKTQHIYSTGLNGALQFEHNTWTVPGRQTDGKWSEGGESESYRDVRCLAGVVMRFEHEQHQDIRTGRETLLSD